MSDTPETIHVLVIDDDQLPRDYLKRAFEVARAAEFRFEVDDAASLQEYHQKVRGAHYDVLVVDLRLATSQEGIDGVCQFHRLHSPDTIMIAYTAFPDLDVLRSCVEVMRAGAVDCIAKSSDGALRAVVDRAVDELRQRRAPEGGPSSEWLEANLPMLVEKFGGKAVAIVGQQIVRSADTVGELRKLIAEMSMQIQPVLMVVPDWKEP